MPEIYLPKKPITTDWVTVADISGIGTAAVTSARMNVLLPAVSISDMMLEIEYKAMSTTSTGSDIYSYVWAEIAGVQVNSATDGSATQSYYTPKSQVVALQKTRRIFVRPVTFFQPVIGLVEDVHQDRVNVRIKASGNTQATGFSVTGIRARLIYTPL